MSRKIAISCPPSTPFPLDRQPLSSLIADYFYVYSMSLTCLTIISWFFSFINSGRWGPHSLCSPSSTTQELTLSSFYSSLLPFSKIVLSNIWLNQYKQLIYLCICKHYSQLRQVVYYDYLFILNNLYFPGVNNCHFLISLVFYVLTTNSAQNSLTVVWFSFEEVLMHQIHYWFHLPNICHGACDLLQYELVCTWAWCQCSSWGVLWPLAYQRSPVAVL